jgi:transmembrane sensor
MVNQRFLYLTARKLTGEASEPELEELERYLEENKDQEQLYKSLFSEKVVSTEVDWLNAQQAYAAHFVKMQVNNQFNSTGAALDRGMPVKQHTARKWLLATVCIVLVIAGGWWYTSGSGIYNRQMVDAVLNKNEIVTKKGSKTNVRLPDGTQVWLNADSKISYAETFQGATREVQLTGEAFFDVVKDKSRPFIIHTATIDIRVLGTAFNVRSYPDEKSTETALVRGEIEVTLTNQPDKKKIILKPKDKLTVANGNNVVYKIREGNANSSPGLDVPVMTLGKMSYIAADTSASADIMWMSNKLAFDSETFDKVASKIGRWYNKEVFIKDESLRTLRFTGVFEDETIEEILQALQLTNRMFTFEVINGQVIIHAN